MSKLEELIQELCPDGIEYKKLIEICDSLKKGTLKTSNLDANGKYPVINSGRELYGFYNEYNNKNAITFAARGEYAGYISYFENEFWAGGLCYPYSSKNEKIITNKFLYYYLKNNENKIMENLVARGSIPALNKSDIDKFLVPVPPLEVQCKIVRILDKFTSISTELLNLLSIELSSRQNQYEHYKNTLLKNYSNEANTTLKDIAEYSKDRINAVELNEDNYVGVDNLLQNKQGKRKSEHIPKEGNSTRYHINDILIGNIRPYLKKIWLATNEGGTNGDVLAIHIIKEDINPKYLYNILSSDQFFDYDNNNAKGAKMPRGNKEAIMNYKFFLPNINEQNKIVNILEAFEKISNNISLEIPVEIEARKKQYEYYRNKLLSFKEVDGDE